MQVSRKLNHGKECVVLTKTSFLSGVLVLFTLFELFLVSYVVALWSRFFTPAMSRGPHELNVNGS